MALGERRQRTQMINGVRYYEVDKGHDTIYIVAAVGHLFTIRQRTQGGEIPVFDIEWVESYKVNQTAYYTKKYLDVIGIVGKKCTEFINACDYDIEGTVIGTNIIKQVSESNVNSEKLPATARRMKFSTTTDPDLIYSYDHLNNFDISNFYAGETRHKIDWMWGINLSRALMRAIATGGVKKVLSIGRVQGPSLGILAQREYEIKNFVPKPYWKVSLICEDTTFDHKRGQISDKDEAERIAERTKKAKIVVKAVVSEPRSMRPFPPFDLTSLQIEANRALKIDPSRTLAIAQVLYERSYISYPRTSSQKLPNTLNLPGILSQLAKSSEYKEHAEKLIRENRYRPAEGVKEDEAHPAVHPTGVTPERLTEEEKKVYDIITRRFLSCFAEYAELESTKIILDANGEEFEARGDIIKKNGWLDFYPYYKPKTGKVPKLKEGESVTADKVATKKDMTEPPRRYNKASLIATLEDKDLGTKATRAEVIDTLFKREYVKGANIEVTGFGLSIYDALKSYSKTILDEQMTRKLEKDMDEISKGRMQKEEVINEGKQIITTIIGEFTANEQAIGRALMEGLRTSEVENSLGRCKCGNGNLMVRRSRAGKTFVGCSAWPKCTITYSLPQAAKIVPTGKMCEICHTPKVKVFRRGKRVFEMDLDPACPTKAGWAKDVKTATEKEAAKEKEPEEKPVAKEAREKKVADKTTAKKPRKAKTIKPSKPII